MKRKIKVHVADDHMVLIEGIIAMINTDDTIEVVGYSQTGTEVLNWFKKESADVLVLDINMPEKDGIEVLKAFKEIKDRPKIIMLSSFDDIRFIQELTTIGADGFIAKTSAGDHIIKAIKSVYGGESYFDEEVKNGLFKLFVGEDVPEGLKPSKDAEKIRYRIVQASYKQAENTIELKQVERYETVIKNCNSFKSKHSESDYSNQVEAILKDSKSKIARLTDSSTVGEK